MNADSNNIAIVITGPDTRDVSTRTFELREHECCAAHFKDHFIFAMPRDYGLPKGGDNRPSIKFEEYDLWGKGPIAILTSKEAAVVARSFLTRWFVFISTRASDGGLPTVGYCVEYRDWYAINRYVKNKPKRELAEGEYFISDLCRALRITVNEQGPGFTICPVVMEKSFLAVHDYRMFRVGTWQRQAWDCSAGLIPDADLEAYRFRRTPQEPKEYPQLADAIGPVDRLRFIKCHLFQHWETTGEKLGNRSGDISRISGQVATDKNNFRNSLVDAGCLNPSRSFAEVIFKRLRTEAHLLRNGTETEELVDWKHPHGLASMLAVLYPQELGYQIECGGDPTNLNYLSI